jgi:hypothetical protein
MLLPFQAPGIWRGVCGPSQRRFLLFLFFISFYQYWGDLQSGQAGRELLLQVVVQSKPTVEVILPWVVSRGPGPPRVLA